MKNKKVAVSKSYFIKFTIRLLPNGAQGCKEFTALFKQLHFLVS